MTLRERIVASWYRPHLTLLTAALAPLAILFGAIVQLRRAAYRLGWRRGEALPVPVIVVGNLTVGGTGKTPLVLALAEALRARGFHPGIVSRGFGRAGSDPALVHADDLAQETGDESLLMARRGWPVAVAARRVDAARAILHHHKSCDILIADDGLQHYALPRDVEIAVVDGTRGFGNRWLLPAGPLREPVSRLRAVDAVVINDAPDRVESHLHPHVFSVRMVPQVFINVADPTRTATLDAFAGTKAHALAAIGHPERFFQALRALRIDAVTRSYPDHHALTAQDLAKDAVVILMTEKDAVKCAGFADARCWYLRMETELDIRLIDHVAARLEEITRDAPSIATSSALPPH